jgi:lipopolysaccharide transport system ATP-binding protein
MSDIAIRVENLGKRYLIGRRQAQYETIRDTMTELATAPFRRLRHRSQPTERNETIWALKDVSFELRRGEVLGVIGRNGAGKTTLLKILSRITLPTEGRAEIHGRVGSLLEVGTGFHPELTGRENIYLNGAILGMKRTEIDSKFDEIVEFAEIERFLDTPVKRYSSGMYVRLAFAVAAHLEPEILLVDEVLAVGDAAFQKKCLGKMGEIGSQGRTVVLVSHNMRSITKLCELAVWIDNGGIRALTDAEKAVETYLTSGLAASEGKVVFREADGTKEAFIRSVELRDKHGRIASQFDVLSPITVDVTFYCKRRFADWRIFLSVTRYDGTTVFSTTTWDYNPDRYPIEPGAYRARLLIPGRFLGSASYMLTVAFGEPPIRRHDVHENALRLDVLGEAFEYGRSIGLLAYPFEWRVDTIAD